MDLSSRHLLTGMLLIAVGFYGGWVARGARTSMAELPTPMLGGRQAPFTTWEYATLETRTVTMGAAGVATLRWHSADTLVDGVDPDGLMAALGCQAPGETLIFMNCIGNLGWELAAATRNSSTEGGMTVGQDWTYWKRQRRARESL